MILDQFKLTNRTALVIGGNRGLGIEMSKALAEAGASVAVAARDVDRNAEAVSILEPLGEGKTMGVACDVLDESLVNKAVQEVHEEMGSIDILINSAGINFRGAIDEVPVEEFRKVMDVNVTGTWLGCKAVTPIMKKQEALFLSLMVYTLQNAIQSGILINYIKPMLLIGTVNCGLDSGRYPTYRIQGS